MKKKTAALTYMAESGEGGWGGEPPYVRIGKSDAKKMRKDQFSPPLAACRPAGFETPDVPHVRTDTAEKAFFSLVR